MLDASAVLLEPLSPASKGELAWPPPTMFKALSIHQVGARSDLRDAGALLWECVEGDGAVSLVPLLMRLLSRRKTPHRPISTFP